MNATPFDGRDFSYDVAVAALLDLCDEHGESEFDALAVRYCQLILRIRRDEREAAPADVGTLSVEDARHHLAASVLPRLAADGLVTVDEADGLPTRVRVPPERWATLATSRESWHTRALEAARQAAHVAEQAPSESAGGSLLEGHGLTKIYGRRRAADAVDVAVRQREIVGLLGPNGAGKTTTFYMLTGIIRPNAGRIVLDGVDITEKPMYRRARLGIGYLAQEPSVFRKLTVEQNLLAILETLPLSGAERNERLEKLLDELAIKHLRKQRAYQLSGGERRRLEITRALVTSPKFMLLDEPFAGVDPIAVHDIQTIVAGLRHRGIGVVITDHNVEQTLDIVDRAYIMFEGRVQVAGSVRELVFDDRVADLYLGPTLTTRLRKRLTEAA
jgi:lipopolysaccharide export system ATP-binding protein